MPMERVEREQWITKTDFHRRIGQWYRESHEEQIGSPDAHGLTGWLWVRDGHLLAKLDADTTRSGVGEYLALLRDRRGDLVWSVVESARGQPTKIAFGDERRTIPGFYLYLYKLGA